MKKKILFASGSMELGGIERSLAALLSAFNYERYEADLQLYARSGELLSDVDERCRILPEIPACAALTKSVRELIRTGQAAAAAARLSAKASTVWRTRAAGRSDGAVFAALQANWEKSMRLIPRLEGRYDAAVSFMWPHHFVAEKVDAARKIAWVHTDYTVAEMDFARDEKVWRKYDRIAAVSTECADHFLKVYPRLEDKMCVIENLLDVSFIRRQALAGQAPEMKGEGGKILSVGRICYQKAFDVAAQSCKLLLSKRPDTRWFVIGYGPDEERLRQIVADFGLEGRFVIIGKKANPYHYMAACDVYAQPSRYEGKAVTVREAQILGKPVLITDFPTSAGQLKDGVDGIVCPFGAQNVADALDGLLNDETLRLKLSDNCLATDYSNREHLQTLYDFIEGRIR